MSLKFCILFILPTPVVLIFLFGRDIAHAYCLEDACKADINFTKADYWCDINVGACRQYQCVTGNDAECQGTLGAGRNLGPGFVCNPTTKWCERPLGNTVIAGNKAGGGYVLSGTGLGLLINNTILAIGAVSGLIFLAMLILGGIAYMTSQGDEKMLNRAKQQITAGLIGLLIIFMSWWAVKIIGFVFGIDLLVPKFTGP